MKAEIRSDGMGGEGDAHPLILQAPQAENCSWVTSGCGADLFGQREVEEEVSSKGEPKLCLMSIMVEKKRETHNGRTQEGGWDVREPERMPLFIQSRP